MSEIKLTQGKVAIVDDDDFEWLNKFKWFASRVENRYYVRRSLPHSPGEPQKQISMQETILGTIPQGMEIDHRDGNGLNNKRENIRFCSHHQNLMNKKGHSKTSSFKGVSRRKGMNKFKAAIEINGKPIHLGYFWTEKEAALEYNRAAEKYFGEYAYLNKFER